MRICFVSSMHSPTDKRVFDKEARTLAAAGHEVIHLAPGDGSEWIQEGIRIVTYRAGGGLRARALRLVTLYRSARRLDADVYHCNEVDSWVVGVALRLVARRRCVFDVHEHYPEEFAEKRFPAWARRPVRGVIGGLMRMLARGTDRIVLAKRSLEPAFQGLPDERVWLVQNFVSVRSLPPERKQRADDGPVRMVHLGLFNRYRGWPQLLEGMAQARCAQTELLVVGTINDGSEEDFQRTVERLGLSDRVRMEPWLPFEEAMARLVASDVGVICFQPGFFNHEHALPHKLFDYMGAGLAVIAPEVSVEVRGIVAESGCGVLVDTADPASIASGIDRLCEDPGARREMGRRGRAAVLERYNWETEAERLTSMYQALSKG